jgi:adenylate cyclase
MVLDSAKSEQLGIYHAMGYVTNTPLLQQSAKYFGFINIFPDADGIVRRAPLVIQYGQDIYPSLALRAVMLFLDKNIALFTPNYNNEIKLEGVHLGNHLIPTDASGRSLIPFIGNSYTFPYYSATDVLHDRIDKNVFLGKIVFIGTTALGLGDLQATSVQSPYPGVEIHATIANGILQDIFSSEPAWTRGAELFFTLLFGLLAAFIFPYLGPRMLAFLIIIFPPGLLIFNNSLWNETGLVLSLLMPCLIVLSIALLNIIYGYLFESRKREHLKNMFGQYVPEEHIDEMLKNPGNYALHGESRELSVLFADIRNFTTISENLSASELVRMLNTLFTPMTEIIFKHQGTIDKYVGDLIMAFWGAPLKDKSHAEHAIEAALEMQNKIKSLREKSLESKDIEIYMGMGINSGVMNVGDMGSKYRRNYTVVGDAVNLASRVESLTKFYGVNIIVTENTQANQNKFVFRKLDHVRVKGKKAAISIYEVICLQTELTEEMMVELESYHAALDFYFQQKWTDALILMTQLQAAYPSVKIYQIYMNRIEEFKNQILPVDWDGVYVHAAK